MATNAGSGAAKQLLSARTATARWKKYTVQPSGFWARVSRLLAIDPNRSTGIPLNPQFRNPPPGANFPNMYDDPITLPAGDIAENPYYKRDSRRNYPRPSIVKQADVVGLLTLGSAAKPIEGRLVSGEEGGKQLVAVRKEGEERGVAGLFERQKGVLSGVLGEGGLPPMPVAMGRGGGPSGKMYVMDQDREEGFPEE
ncbi:hypothetical protein MMC34_002098 [Xylographa carneopallida]|nr:hypothetical protein [Xylographa carneopallida]